MDDPAIPLPDDDPETFHRKLVALPADALADQVLRFEGYARRAALLRFHAATLRRPESNVRLTHNARHGWHASSCMRSLPDYAPEDSGFRDPCTCEADFRDPESFFLRVEEEVGLAFRCRLCKRYVPDSEAPR